MKQAEVDELPAGLCVGLGRLFDSTDPDDHERAANLCAVCPRSQWCEDELKKHMRAEHVNATEGTWAGRLLIDTRAPNEPTRRDTCGTSTGVYHHRRNGEMACDVCSAARRAYDRGRGK